MDKDALASVGVIALLLAVVIAATVINNRQQLVATRPEVNSVVSETLGALLGIAQEQEAVDTMAETNTACPLGCTVNPSPQAAAGAKQQLQADPIPYVRDAVTQKFTRQLQDHSLETVYSVGTNVWWRSDEGYRIQMDAGKTLAVQLPTTITAYQLAPSNSKGSDTHPAMRHPTLSSVEKEIVSAMKELDYKQVKNFDCPVNEAYDPFNNCVAAFTHKKNDQKCLLLAGYGKYAEQTGTDNPYLRLELGCADSYQNAYNLAAPYLYAINLINPDWLIPDTAVYAVTRESGDLVKVNFGYATSYFQEIDNGLRLVGRDGDDGDRSCALIRDNEDMIQLTCSK